MTRSSFICTATLFAIENVVYLALVSGIYSSYSKRTMRRYDLLQFRPYQLYDRTFINSYPTANGQEFYKLINKLTITFNVLILVTFIMLLLINAAAV